MSFLDSQDTVERLYSLLPSDWFADLADSPNLNGVLSMLGASYSNDVDGLWQFLQYVATQTRIFTATGFWLDIAAQDYFGAVVQRHTNESDTSFRRRIILNLLAPRGTRPALSANVTNLTGIEPKIIELRNPGDCGAYSSIENPIWGGCVYNQMGAYGTMSMPFQLLINVTRPPGEGIPVVGGYSMPGWGYATYPPPFGYVGGNRPPVNTYGVGEYVELSDIIGQVTDSDIYDTITRTMPMGTTAWTAISSPLVESPPTGGGAMLNSNFYLDMSVLAASAPIIAAGLGAGIFVILAHGAMQEQADLLGMLKFPKVQVANALITEAPPLTWQGLWTMPSIKAMGAMSGLPSKLTISITMPEVIIYTTTVQPRLPFNMPFVLGTIPNAQPLLGVSFVLGTSAPGEIGGVAITPATTVCDVGSLEASIPPQLNSVSTVGIADVISIGGVNLSESNTLASVQSICTAGQLGFTPQLLLPTTLPFLLGASGSQPINVTTSVSGVSSTCVVGVIQSPLHLVSVVSSVTASAVTVTSSHSAQILSSTRKTSTITLSNGNMTATQTAGSSDDAVYGVNTATSGAFYWEVTTTFQNAATIFAGIGNLSAPDTAGAYVGSSLSSLGWDANDGSVRVNGTSIATWTPWTSTANPTAPGSVTNTAQTSSSLSYSWSGSNDVVTVSFALDATNGLVWGRVNGGSWFGSTSGTTNNPFATIFSTQFGAGTQTSGSGILVMGVTPLGTPAVVANPATGTNGLTIPSSVLASALAPGATVNTSGDTVTANFAAASWIYTPPAGFGSW